MQTLILFRVLYLPIFIPIDFFGMPEDSKISCLFVPLQDQKHLGKESLHMYKEAKTCHPRNREISAIAKLRYTKTPLFYYALWACKTHSK